MTRKHLDLEEAEIVRATFLAKESDLPAGTVDSADLDLSQYSSASLDALRHLADLKGGFASIGFEDVTPAMAEVMRGWSTYFFLFQCLQQGLSHDASLCLGDPDAGHGLSFEMPIVLAVEAAKALADNGAPLSLNFDSEPSPQNAQALACHVHELYLTFPELASPDVARALINHSGYSLTLELERSPAESILHVLASHPDKKFAVTFRNRADGANDGVSISVKQNCGAKAGNKNEIHVL